jgi:hypothetical protein
MATKAQKLPQPAGCNADKKGNRKRVSGAWLYGKLSSQRLSIYILSVMGLFYALGSLFPQGVTTAEYAEASGRFAVFTGVFNLLGFYTSPLFILAALVLALNLVVCIYDRYVFVIGPRARTPVAGGFSTDYSLLLTHNMHGARSEANRVLTEDLGFKAVAGPGDWTVMEKGLPYRLLTWLYHVGIMVCFIAFTLTYLLAYEGVITLWPGVPDTVSPASTGRLQRLLGRTPQETTWSVMLDEFSAEYVHAPALEYPEDPGTRLAIGLGWKAPRYTLEKGSMALKDTRSALRIIENNKMVLDKVIEVNDPMRYGGYTFYQSGSVQTLKIRVDNGPIPLETQTDSDLFIPGLKSPLKFKTVITGTLLRLDKGVEEILPYTIVTRTVKTKQTTADRELGRLWFDGSIRVDGKRLTIAGFSQGTVLKFRYDPGVLLLWWGAIFVLIAMALRFYGAWYMAAYNLSETNGIVLIRIHVSTVGLRANKARLIKRIEDALTRDDIRPTPVLQDAGIDNG